eukprot:9192873-Alexandrium_andersonii.AAC.1
MQLNPAPHCTLQAPLIASKRLEALNGDQARLKTRSAGSGRRIYAVEFCPTVDFAGAFGRCQALRSAQRRSSAHDATER